MHRPALAKAADWHQPDPAANLAAQWKTKSRRSISKSFSFSINATTLISALT
jgi:hypothetical protein